MTFKIGSFFFFFKRQISAVQFFNYISTAVFTTIYIAAFTAVFTALYKIICKCKSLFRTVFLAASKTLQFLLLWL